MGGSSSTDKHSKKSTNLTSAYSKMDQQDIKAVEVKTGQHTDNSDDEKFPLTDVPRDILFEILKWVPAQDIVHSCVYVCRQWKQEIDTQMFWKEKCVHDLRFPNEVFRYLIDEDFKKLYFKRPYQYNLIRNPDASEEFVHWTKVENGGDGWKVEVPVGCEPVEDFAGIDKTGKETRCWTTSFSKCSKFQTIDLLARGCSPLILDEIKPDIHVSEWYAARFDCGIKYKLTVQLLKTKDSEPITEWTFKDTKPAGREWFKAEHTFSKYEPGVRFIRFYHEGKDTQFWAGWYGAKITLSSVVLDLKHTACDL